MKTWKVNRLRYTREWQKRNPEKCDLYRKRYDRKNRPPKRRGRTYTKGWDGHDKDVVHARLLALKSA